MPSAVREARLMWIAPISEESGGQRPRHPMAGRLENGLIDDRAAADAERVWGRSHAGRWSLRARADRLGWVVTFVTVVVLVLNVTAAVALARAQAGRRHTTESRFEARQASAARFLDAYVAQEFDRQQQLATVAFAGAVDTASFTRTMRLGGYSVGLLVDDEGRVLASDPTVPGLVGRTMKPLPAPFRLALDGQPVVTDVTVLGGDLGAVIGFAVAFETPSGRRVFAGGYPVAHTPLQPLVANALSAFKTGTVYLLDSTGTVIASSQPRYDSRSLRSIQPALAQALEQHPSGRLSAAGAAPGGHPRQAGRTADYYSSGAVAGTRWRLVFTIGASELYANLSFRRTQTWLPWLLLAALIVMSLLVGVLLVRAIGRRVRAEEDHARQEQILNTAADAFIGMNAEGRITDWNTSASRLLGWDRADAIGQPVADLIIPAGLRDQHRQALQRFLQTGIPVLPTEPIPLTAQRRDGRILPIELTVSRSQWNDSWRFHAFMRDITERLAHEQQLHELALTDPLTALANRRAFLERLVQAHARAERHGTGLAVLYADVDHFKQINDHYGHTAGDQLLIQVADRLRAQSRSIDTVGRLGGDEFAVIWEDLSLYSHEDTRPPPHRPAGPEHPGSDHEHPGRDQRSRERPRREQHGHEEANQDRTQDGTVLNRPSNLGPAGNDTTADALGTITPDASMDLAGASMDLAGASMDIAGPRAVDLLEALSGRIRTALAVPYTYRDELIPATVTIGTALHQPGSSTQQLLEDADAAMYAAKHPTGSRRTPSTR